MYRYYNDDWSYKPNIATTTTTSTSYTFKYPRYPEDFDFVPVIRRRKKSLSEGYWMWVEKEYYMPEACMNCPNHPLNGGDGICHCILGLKDIYC